MMIKEGPRAPAPRAPYLATAAAFPLAGAVAMPRRFPALPSNEPGKPERRGSFTKLQRPTIDEAAVAKDAFRKGNDPDNCVLWMRLYIQKHLDAGTEFWVSETYIVFVASAERMGLSQSPTPVLWLRVFRRDGTRIRHHWRELQRIKNELVGPDHVGMEIYPREQDLQDGENSYHLWVFAEPGAALPWGLRAGRNAGADGARTTSVRFINEGASTLGR